MAKTSWEKLVPKNNIEGQKAKQTIAKKGWDRLKIHQDSNLESEKPLQQVIKISDLIKKLSFLPYNTTEKPGFDIITIEEPTRDLRTIIPEMKVLLPKKY